MSKQKWPGNYKRNLCGFNKMFNDKSAADEK
jgi:hypothetical protein